MWEAAGSGSGRWCEPPGLRVRTVCSSLFGWELLVVVIGSYSLHLLICIEAHYLLRSVAYNNERKKKPSSYYKIHKQNSKHKRHLKTQQWKRQWKLRPSVPQC